MQLDGVRGAEIQRGNVGEPIVAGGAERETFGRCRGDGADVADEVPFSAQFARDDRGSESGEGRAGGVSVDEVCGTEVADQQVAGVACGKDRSESFRGNRGGAEEVG